jgi:ABC-type transport system involved in multi-copper enzyme maturation permease subunit
LDAIERGKGRPFLELFSSSLNEDYRFPLLEVFCFLYAISAFIFAGFSSGFVGLGASGDAVAYSLTSSLLGFPLFIFVVLILKNVAFGLGNDLEKGIVQTFFSYPIKRRWILSAKLLSAVGAGLIPFVGILIAGLYVLAPGVVGPHIDIVLLTFATNLSEPLLVAGIVLLVTLLLKRGALALVLGIVTFFAIAIVQGIVSVIAAFTNNVAGLQVLSLISPNLIEARYFITQSTGPLFGPSTSWSPTFSDVLAYTAGSYIIVAIIFLLGYVYFSRKLNL